MTEFPHLYPGAVQDRRAQRRGAHSPDSRRPLDLLSQGRGRLGEAGNVDVVSRSRPHAEPAHCR